MWALVLGRGGFEPPKALGQLIYSQSRLTASVSARPGDFTDNRPMGNRRWILEWSPSTNALPIRRMALKVGETRAVTAAWVRFPSLQVQRPEQSYEHLAEERYWSWLRKSPLARNRK